jgi:hypothetical protein
MARPDRYCIDCGRVLDGPCQFCADQQERIEEKLEVCRANQCGEYKSRGAKDGCKLLGKTECCNLAARLKHGWKCPKGLHRDC